MRTVSMQVSSALNFIIFYLLCVIAYSISPFAIPSIIGTLTFVGETGMDILIFLIAFQLFNKSNKENRILFGLLGISFFFEAFADGCYNIVQNIYGISNPSILISSLYEVPLLLFLFLQTSVWYIFFKEINKKNRHKLQTHKFIYIPFIASSLLVIAIFLYFADWKIARTSAEGLYQLADVFIEALGFSLVSIFLGASKNKYISSIAIGFLIIVCANYMIRLPVVALATSQNSPYEFTWIIGQLFIFYGLSKLTEVDLKSSLRDWCYSLNSLQPQISSGGFTLGLLLIVLFAIFIKCTATANDGKVLQYLPAIMMIISITTAILSASFSKRLLKPLNELELAIDTYSLNEECGPILESHNDYGIREYIQLKDFIKKALISLSEKYRTDKEIAALAASVMHDIASPLAVMNIILNSEGHKLSDKTKVLLEDSVKSIRNISYKLLDKFRNQSKLIDRSFLKASKQIESNPKDGCIFLSEIIESLLKRKIIEWKINPCAIDFDIRGNKDFYFVYADPIDFTRVLSNLLNNAYEALQTERTINITLFLDANSLMCLSIADNGCGVAPEFLPKVLCGESLKHNGKGLGLSCAKDFIESLGGKLIFESEAGKGSEVKLFLPHPIY